jgi:type IV pilus assembly protein PilE
MKHSSKRRSGYAAASHARGVTLIELMIVVVIIGILGAIAYPSYQRYVARTHRTAAAACLSQFAQGMERYYTTNLSYEDGDDRVRPGCQTENDLNRFYNFVFPAAPTQSTFRVEARPTDVQTRAERALCGTLSIDETGRRLPDNDACR